MSEIAVYAAINAVQEHLSKTGISKDRKASGGGASYNFRGIDDVYSALATLLATHKLVIIPRMISRDVAERTTKNGNAIFYTTVHAEFDLVSSIDGSKHTASTFGEAMDTSDKSTNKAMSAAYKYMAFLTFCIPVQGEENDTESAHHEVQSEPPESVELFLSDFRAAMKNGHGPAFWEAGWPDIPKQWRPFVVAQKDAIKAEISNQQKAA